MNDEEYVKDLFEQFQKESQDNYEYNLGKHIYKSHLGKNVLMSNKELKIIIYLLDYFKHAMGVGVVSTIIEIIRKRRFPYKTILGVIFYIVISAIGIYRFKRAIDKIKPVYDPEFDQVLDEFYFNNYYKYDLFEQPDEVKPTPNRRKLPYVDETNFGQTLKDQIKSPFEIPTYSYYDLAEIGGTRFGPPTKDQLDYINNSMYKEPIEPQLHDSISSAWASSLPALLIKYGVPGLLAGGAIYGGYKLYDWYTNKPKINEQNQQKEMENQMNNIVEAGVYKEPKDYSITDDKPIPILYKTDLETSEKIKRLIK